MRLSKFTVMTVFILASFVLVACQPKLEPENDCNFVMSSQIQRVSWKNNLPVRLYITPQVPVELRESIRVAASQWNYQLGMEALLIYEADNVPSEAAKDGVNGIYWVKDWTGNTTTEQARTTIYWVGDTIREADVLINARDHRFSSFGNLASDTIDFTSLIVHEFGHVLGLQHVDSEPSVMATTLAYNTQRLMPTETDLNSLRCEYN